MENRHGAAAALLGAALLLAGGCPGGDVFFEGDGGTGGDCKNGAYRCSGNDLQLCSGGAWLTKYPCGTGKVCSAKLQRCTDCQPSQNFCKGDAVFACDANGTAGAKVQQCASGSCLAGACTDACSVAASSRSYVGCRYWPTITANSTLSRDFSFAVVVANAHDKPAQVTVTRGGNPVASATVQAAGLSTIKLPWVTELKQDGGQNTWEESALVPSAAFLLQSTLPVTVYQFNALNYVLNHDCTQGSDAGGKDGKCYAYSNDASLLLPDHVLTKEYMVITRPTMGLKWQNQYLASPAFFAVVAVKPGATQVKATFSANTHAGKGGLSAYQKGQSGSFTLQQGGVLQIVSQVPSGCTASKSDATSEYCDLSSTTDLTGTTVSADKEIALYAGHNCAFVPFDKWACDHLEEQLFPLKTWGKRYLASHVASSGKDPSVYRIVSAEAGNRISFDPVQVHAAVTLNKGQYLELTTAQDFEVKGSGPFALAQFMVGQNYSDPNPGKGAPGDPAMGLAVPVEQFRTSYRFLAPQTYSQNYVNILAPSSATVKLDGKAVAAHQFKPVGSSGYKVAKLSLAGGSHTVTSEAKVGIAVYGVGSYTSYMYPGGLDLRLLY